MSSSAEHQPIHHHHQSKPSFYARTYDFLERIPLKFIMNIISIVVCLSIIPVIIFDIIGFHFDPLHWIVSGYIVYSHTAHPSFFLCVFIWALCPLTNTLFSNV